MKHKFIALSVLTLLVGMVSQPLIGVRADTYRPTLYDLDYPQAELNNKTIRETFEDYYMKDSENLIINFTIPVSDITDTYYKYDSLSNNSSLDNYYYAVGKNLFNKSNAVFGFYINTVNGQTTSSAIKSVSEYIRIKPSTAYQWTESDGFAWYDYNKLFLSSSSGTTVTSPSNAQFLRLTITNTNTFQLELGSTATAYETYIKPTHLYNISDYITTKQYSPLYDTTFDLMTGANIKTQMDYFMTNPLYFLDFDEVGPLTNAQIDYWYDHYQTLKWFEINDIPVGNQIRIDSDIMTLIIAMVFFAIGCFFAWKTDNSWLYAISGLLWFAPIFLIENIFIIIFSVSMIIFSTILAFWQKE